MARPTQNTIDYFSHDCQHTKTMYILESRYKNDGYAFWFKLLETLGSTPNHFIDLGDDAAQEFMAAKANITWDYCEEILTLLAKIQAICPVLWEKKIVWCQNFTDRLATIYGKRGRELPSKPSFCDGKVTIPVVSVTETPQSKLKESRLNNITIKQKENNIPAFFDKKASDDLPFTDEPKEAEPEIEKASKSAYSSDFESFWSEYPAKVAKGAAAKSFKKAVKKASVSEIMNGLANYCNSRKVAEGFVCNPSTWLNQERWNDVCEPVEIEIDPNQALTDEQLEYIYAMEERIAKEEAEKAKQQKE